MKEGELTENTIKAYGVMSFAWDGGGSDKELFADIDRARQVLLQRVKEAQEEDNKVYESDPEDAPLKWHEAEKDLWTNGMDSLSIQEYNFHS